ncbi:MAG: methyltransferase [Tenericutes bacterium]|nr:methyltransferase [Mycoplasmatota bacterium]
MNNSELNDLYDTGFKIYQSKDYFKFSLDSLLLANFVEFNFTDKLVLDLCTGNAPVPIILSENKKIKIYGFELQKEIYELAVKSIKVNQIDNVEIINDDVKNSLNYFPGNNFDIVTCNPPYFKYTKNSIINENEIKSIARHEIKITLEDIIKIATKQLKAKGKFYIVHRSDRLIEIINYLNKYNFGIKKLQFVYSSIDANSSMVLIEAKKDCKNDVKVLKPIIKK